MNGRFLNDFGTHEIHFRHIVKWKFSRNPQKEEKAKDPYRLQVLNDSRFLYGKEDRIVWLGQGTFFIQLGGMRILTDPCLTDLPFRKRLAGLPCRIEDIHNIDYLLVSHNHLDHLDKRAMKKTDFTGTTALLPLRLGETVKAMNGAISVQEGGWYQKFSTDENISVWLLPALHWSRRSLRDTNRTLWGSYMIRGGRRTVYFAGDSSYAGHFREIATLFPDIDACLMPIGAYRPDFVMKQSHMTPKEAVQGFNDLRGRVLVPMHYATYDLSDEPAGEPIRLLEELDARGMINGKMKRLDVGEILYL